MGKFSPKAVEEVHLLSFDFSEFLSPNETIVMTSVKSNVCNGKKDPEVRNFVYGNSFVDGAVVSQRVSGGVAGATYKLTCTAETSTKQVLKLMGTIQVTDDELMDELESSTAGSIIEKVAEVKESPDLIEEIAEQLHEALNEEPEEPAEVEAKSIETQKFSFNAIEVKEVQANGLNVGRIAGYASTYNIDRVGDMVMPGAFTKTIKSFNEEKRPIRMYYQHDEKELIGAFNPTHMKEDANGLYVEGDINLDVQRGREVYALAKQGVLSDMSIGYVVKDFEMAKGVRLLKDIDLWEISVVSEPANPKAKILQVKSVTELKETVHKKSDLEKVLRDAGFSRSAAKYIAALTDETKFEDSSVTNNDTTPCDEVVEAVKDNDMTNESKDILDDLLEALNGDDDYEEDAMPMDCIMEPEAESEELSEDVAILALLVQIRDLLKNQ